MKRSLTASTILSLSVTLMVLPSSFAFPMAREPLQPAFADGDGFAPLRKPALVEARHATISKGLLGETKCHEWEQQGERCPGGKVYDTQKRDAEVPLENIEECCKDDLDNLGNNNRIANRMATNLDNGNNNRIANRMATNLDNTVVYSMRHGESVGNYCASKFTTKVGCFFTGTYGLLWGNGNAGAVADGFLTGLEKCEKGIFRGKSCDTIKRKPDDPNSGWQQANKRYEDLKDDAKEKLATVEAWVVSPLSRAIQTAAINFLLLDKDEKFNGDYPSFIVNRNLREKSKSKSDQPLVGKWKLALEWVFAMFPEQDRAKEHIRKGILDTLVCPENDGGVQTNQDTCLNYNEINNNELTMNKQLVDLQAWLEAKKWSSVFLISHSGINRYLLAPVIRLAAPVKDQDDRGDAKTEAYSKEMITIKPLNNCGIICARLSRGAFHQDENCAPLALESFPNFEEDTKFGPVLPANINTFQAAGYLDPGTKMTVSGLEKSCTAETLTKCTDSHVKCITPPDGDMVCLKVNSFGDKLKGGKPLDQAELNKILLKGIQPAASFGKTD